MIPRRTFVLSSLAALLVPWWKPVVPATCGVSPIAGAVGELQTITSLRFYPCTVTYRQTLKLMAVVLDKNGLIKPVADVSYAPDGGWDSVTI